MSYSLCLQDAHWQNICTIRKGTPLRKGRNDEYYRIQKETDKIGELCGVYCWSDEDKVYYVGSFANQTRTTRFKTNFSQRIHNYLQNHRIRISTKSPNTNLRIFRKIVNLLATNDVHLRFFRMSSLVFGLDKIESTEYSNSIDLARLVEHWLIASYKRKNECSWNI